MKYIAIDLEWNQSSSSKDTKILEDGKRFTGEIVQIGAVKLDENLNIESVFKTEIKPKIYTKMNVKVSELTGITGEMLTNAPCFDECIPKFLAWCEPQPVFFTWGVDDIRVLRQNCSLNGINSDFCKVWYNLQVFFNMQTDTGSNQKSLQTAIEHFNIEATLKAHDALNDAYYTAMIAKKLDLERGIQEYPGARSGLCGTDKGKTVFKGVKCRRAALANKEICTPNCPVCDEKFTEIAPFVKANKYKYVSLARCKTHGEFYIKLRIGEKEDGTNNIYRTVRGCSENERQMYDNLVLREAERINARENKKSNTEGI